MLLKLFLKSVIVRQIHEVVGVGFYVWKKHGFFKCFPYCIGLHSNRFFFDLVGFIGLVFVVIR
ncbi:hypothetical protein HpDR51_11620 [Helicobacter pylori]